MAITIIKKPHQISPNGNLNIWMFTSDNPNLIYCVLTMYNATNNNIIAKKKVFKTPMTNYLSTSVTGVLENITESVLYDLGDLITLSNLPAYNVTIQEYTQDNNNNVQAGDITIVAGTFFTFEGEINPLYFSTYNSDNYNINSNTKAKFLTNSDSVKTITNKQKEYLKIFDVNKLARKINISLYDGDNDLIVSTSLEIVENNSKNVINIVASPAVIFALDSIKNNEDLELVEKYRIVLTDANNNEITESRVYNLVEGCEKKEKNIIYKNSIGGWDSILMYNTTETLGTAKTYLNTSISKNNEYSKDNKFFGKKELIDTNNTYTYTATTQYLTDYESVCCKELIISNKVYISIFNYFAEISIDNKTYKVLLKQNNGYKANRLELQYTASFSLLFVQSQLNANDIIFNNNPQLVNYLQVKDAEYVVTSALSNITMKY
ncbi:hypothetical protein [Sphingobacterium siyangense]|uniref:hypothetical protein n=1 Tax=Sphingobacterium siyangense TaxID=459529 RepID=UPI003DA428A2